MAVFLGGMVIGGVFAWMILWKRTRNLEDDLMEKDELLNTAVEMLRRERQERKEWEKCENSGDLFKNW